MSDETSAAIGRIDDLLRDATDLEARAQNLHEMAAVDPFSQAARDAVNKLIVWSSVGILSCTIGNPKQEITVGIASFQACGVLYGAFVVAIIYCISSLYLLSLSDRKRWNAIYFKSVSPLIRDSKAFSQRGADIMREIQLDVQQYYEENSATVDNSPKAEHKTPPWLTLKVSQAKRKIDNIAELVTQISKPAISLKRHFRVSCIVFIILPIALGISSCGVVIYAAFHSPFFPTFMQSDPLRLLPGGVSPAEPRSTR